MRINARIVCSVLLTVLAATSASALDRQRIGSRPAGNQPIEFNIYLPLQNTDQLDVLLTDLHTPGSANYHKWLTPNQFRQRFGPKQSDIERVKDTLSRAGFTVTRVHGHGVHVQGTVGAVENMFGASLWNGRTPLGTSRVITTTPLNMPPVLRELGAQVPEFSPMVRQRTHARKLGALDDNRYAQAGFYWFDDLKQAYSYPSYQALTGKGATIGILMSNGFNPSDMNLYFGHEKLATPKILTRPVAGGAPYDPNLSFETHLDIQQAAGMAPNATVVLYNLPDLSDSSVLEGYLDIVEDNAVDIVSMSFGGPEDVYKAAYNNGTDFTYLLALANDLFKQGNAQGITWVASSGDNGGLELPPLEYFTDTPQNPPRVVGNYLQGISEPADSPHVTAVGGTNLITTYLPNTDPLESQYIRENAYGDPLQPEDPFGTGNLISGGYWGSGGGKSTIFAKPAYQRFIRTGANTRSIPDLSLHMGGCPSGSVTPCGPDRTAVVVAIAGKLYLVVGTSASSPDFAGLLALKIEHLGGRLGNENYEIYALAAAQAAGAIPFQVYRQNIPGFNGVFETSPSYNMVLGNGTLIGKDFILAPSAPVAGDPQTPSNP